ncbi:hypothetical protein N431DRAFT_433791 [Stipitochalara longipes BDJ]|nr:hypothetical protein N431DRAFT_433791 [Stipitochalara longipes BDJ]
MPLKDRFRRAITMPSRSNSSSLSHTPTVPATPTNEEGSTPTPSITLTKTSSRLGLSKTLTWGNRKEKREEKERKRLEDWEKNDAAEWNGRRKPKSKQHQDLLRAFEWKFNAGGMEGAEGGRRWSGWSMASGVSPGTSRMNSVDGERPRRFGSFGMGRKRSSGAGTGPLSREVSRDDGGGVGTVPEE